MPQLDAMRIYLPVKHTSNWVLCMRIYQVLGNEYVNDTSLSAKQKVKNLLKDLGYTDYTLGLAKTTFMSP